MDNHQRKKPRSNSAIQPPQKSKKARTDNPADPLSLLQQKAPSMGKKGSKKKSKRVTTPPVEDSPPPEADESTIPPLSLIVIASLDLFDEPSPLLLHRVVLKITTKLDLEEFPSILL